ncbi:MAG: response regulator, partial [Myxococcales bacterium]|nr:response regulator [Myxococcales bacterium]
MPTLWGAPLKRVLIIEDDRFNRRLYHDLLEAEGYEVDLAASAPEGIDRARQQRPDLVVMDIGLPGMDGLEATRILKTNGGTSRVPVLVISAHALAHHESQARRVGADEFLRKPLRFPEFQQIVRRMLGGAPLPTPAPIRAAKE